LQDREGRAAQVPSVGQAAHFGQELVGNNEAAHDLVRGDGARDGLADGAVSVFSGLQPVG